MQSSAENANDMKIQPLAISTTSWQPIENFEGKREVRYCGFIRAEVLYFIKYRTMNGEIKD